MNANAMKLTAALVLLFTSIVAHAQLTVAVSPPI
jgi:hypothetical protein